MPQQVFNDTRFIATINSWIPMAIDDYLGIERDNNGKLTADSVLDKTIQQRANTLATALKKLATTQSTSESIQEIDALNLKGGEDLDFIIQIIDDPTKIGHDRNSTKKQLKDFISQRLNAFADVVCNEFGISSELTTPPPSYATAMAEHTYVINLYTEILQSNHLFEQRTKSLDIAKGSAHTASLGCFAVTFFFFYCACETDTPNAGLVLIAIAAFFAALGVAITAATYTLIAIGMTFTYGAIHLYDSLAKISYLFSQPLKTFLGLIDTGLTLGGTAASVFGGLIAGAMIGTSLPVIGTMIGAILGASICGVVGLGVAAFISKRLVHLFNPYKSGAELSNTQRHRLENMGVDLAQLNQLITHLHTKKKEIPLLARLYPSDPGHQFKRKISDLIADLKNGSINQEKIQVDGQTFTLFADHKRFEQQQARQQAYGLTTMPQPPAYEAATTLNQSLLAESKHQEPSAPPYQSIVFN